VTPTPSSTTFAAVQTPVGHNGYFDRARSRCRTAPQRTPLPSTSSS
jgi:hypothetical protein